MKICASQKGQSLVELLVAMGVFIVGTVSLGLLALDANVATRQGAERAQAVLFAEEGLSVVRSLRDADFDNLTVGVHGVAISAGKWIFSGASDAQDQFTRTVTITDIDADTKKAVSTVSWQFSGARQGIVAFTEYFTDWNQTQGIAGNLDADISGANINSDQLLGIKIRNTSAGAITIDKITAWWSVAPKIQDIIINATTVWSDNGPGSPSGKQVSGTELNNQDFTLAGNSAWLAIDRFRFESSVTGASFIIKFIMTDASTKYVLVKP